MGNFNFIGSYDYRLDDKHRFNMPAKFRRQAESGGELQFILTIGKERCVDAYPLPRWLVLQESIQALDMNQSQNRLYARLVASQAVDTMCDKQGRITLPTHLCEYAKLTRDIIVVGVFDHIEIWDRENYQAMIHDPMEQLDDLARQVSR